MRIIIPRGTIRPNETAIINIPRHLVNRPVLRAVRSRRNVVLDAVHQMETPQPNSTRNNNLNEGFIDWSSVQSPRTTEASSSLGILNSNQMETGELYETSRANEANSTPRRILTRSVRTIERSSPGALNPNRMQDQSVGSMGLLDQGFLETSESLGIIEPNLMDSSVNNSAEQARIDAFLSQLEEMEFNSLLLT